MMKKVLLILLSCIPVLLMAQQTETEPERKARMRGYSKTMDSVKAVFERQPAAAGKEKVISDFSNSPIGKLSVFSMTIEIMRDRLAVAYAGENNTEKYEAYFRKIKSAYTRADINRKAAVAYSKSGNQELAVKMLKPILDSLLQVNNGIITDRDNPAYSSTVQAYMKILKPGSQKEAVRYLKPLYEADGNVFSSDLSSKTGDDVKKKLFYIYARSLPATTNAKEIAEVISAAFQSGAVSAEQQAAIVKDFRKVPDLDKYLAENDKAGKRQFDEAVKKLLSKNDLNGKALNAADFKGKYVLLDFWGSWCLPCRATHPHLKELYEKYKDKGFEIVGVARESSTDLEKAKLTWKKAVEQDKINWVHVLANENIESFDPPKVFKIGVFPTKILLDKNGNELARFTGGASEVFDKKMKELFGQ